MISVYWLIGGAVFLALEAFGIPGIGFLFAGIAAILVGTLVESGLLLPEAYVNQWGVFFLLTTLMALVLWRRIKAWRIDPNAPLYHNIVGTEAVVTKPLIAHDEGEVRWSGTLMRARLATGEGELPAGATVIVRESKGNVLLVVGK